MSAAYNPQKVAELISAQINRPGALLPILHAIQDELGYIPPDSVTQIAAAVNLTRADVHGVITFYHHFHTTPPAWHTIHVCRAEACQSMGADRLAEHVERNLANSPPNVFEVQPVYCLGLCANAPAIMINEQLHARVTPEKFDRLIGPLADKS
ncbi:MAG TPA: NAD(P)H-dependent oxidoreductase subunit E [Halothiobacillus sp.]|nr:NAD(P)H-dependent oxidoreductase subunit E [Halothiobacillus sp.]